jgi:hypothetical protein
MPEHESEVYRARFHWALREARRMHRFCAILRELFEDDWDLAREEMLERWPEESEVTDADDFAIDAVAKLGLEVMTLFGHARVASTVIPEKIYLRSGPAIILFFLHFSFV